MSQILRLWALYSHIYSSHWLVLKLFEDFIKGDSWRECEVIASGDMHKNVPLYTCSTSDEENHTGIKARSNL